MTVATTPLIAGPFTGTGASASLTFTFKCFASADLLVQRDGSPLVYGADYSVALNADQSASPGGSVNITAAANTSGSAFYITSNAAYGQSTSLPSQGRWSPKVVEGALDRLAISIKQLALGLSRSLLVPFGETLGPLPPRATRSGNYFAFDAAGNPVASRGTGADAGLRTDLAANTGASLISWLRSGVGAVVRTIQDKLNDTPCIKDFGAVGDGATLNDVAITAAIAAVAAAGGGDLLVPAGDFLISIGVQMNMDGVRLRGTSKKKSRLLQSVGSQPVIDVTGSYSGASNLCVDYSGTPTSGSTAAIIAAGEYCDYESIVIPKCYNGFKWTIAPFQTARDVQIFSYVNAAMWLTAVNDIFVSQFIFDAINTTNGAKGGIWLQDRVEAFSFTDGEILNGAYPMVIDATLFTFGNRPAYGEFTNVFFDSAIQAASLNNLVETNFTRCWFSNGRAGSGNPGCLVQQVDTLSFNSCEFFNCGSHGCNVTAAAKRLSFVNCSFESNSVTAGAGVAHGLTFAAGTTNFSVIGGTAHNGLYTGQQGYGIAISAGASDNYSIIGVDVNGNATGGIFDGGTGTNKHILGNPGCRTRNRGIGTIPSGSSSITVAHGLAFTPSQADVLISPNVNLGAAGVNSIWCSAVDATNITVNVNTNCTSNVGFTWDARKGA